MCYELENCVEIEQKKVIRKATPCFTETWVQISITPHLAQYTFGLPGWLENEYSIDEIVPKADDFVDSHTLLKGIFDKYHNGKLAENSKQIMDGVVKTGVSFCIDGEEILFKDYKKYMSEEDIQKYNEHQSSLKE